MTKSIVYIDESDRSYGISGMAISLALLDKEETIMGIDFDRAMDPLDLAHEFYFSGNPRCSARIAWNEMVRHFDLMVAMTIGNILSRRVVSQGTNMSADEESDLRNLVIEEGSEALGLDADETMRIWSKEYDYLKRVFAHPTVRKIAGDLAAEIRQRRIMSRRELLDLLASLGLR